MNLERGTKLCGELLLIVAILLGVVGCSNQDLYIVVPNEFGPGEQYCIVLDKIAGREPETTGRGDYLFQFDSECTVYNTFGPFRTYRHWQFVLKSGETVETRLGSAGGWIVTDGVYAGQLRIEVSNYTPASKGVGRTSGNDNGATMVVQFIAIP